ncbi:MAG: pyridoxal-dependent decarboxylase, partial [Acidobacteria bacterium]|nr:pyridoxal-dependent decarboxylase [Acidobacteriota bacterium]
MRKGDVLDQFFLGPKSEQRLFLKELLELVVDDYIFWRRNYHPKDPPAMPHNSLHSEESEEYHGHFHQELFELISDLKLDVPFFSPRYMAHMVSEVAMPGLVAYLATMLYNPNNVSLEASAVTVEFELEVGQHFARLFGYGPDAAFGHLCSGGTLANYESLW